MTRFQTDILRVLSCLMVLAIHSTGRTETVFLKEQNLFSLDFIGVFLNQWGRFCVPIFILLSGFGLGCKYARPLSLEELREFSLRRLLRIALPYLFWSAALLLFGNKLPGEGVLDSARIFLASLYRGNADYHFYFFSIILQCYALFPILVAIAASRFSGAFFLILVIVEIVFSSPSHLIFAALGIKRTGFFSAFFIYWIFYFYAGVYFAVRKEKFASAIAWKGWIYVYPMVLLVVLVEYIFWSQKLEDPGFFNHFTRASILLYSMAFMFFFLSVRSFASALQSRAAWLIELFSALSFFIYIFHTWILRGLEMIYSAYYFTWPLLVILSFLLAWALNRIIPEKGAGRWIRLAAGLPA